MNGHPMAYLCLIGQTDLDLPTYTAIGFFVAFLCLTFGHLWLL